MPSTRSVNASSRLGWNLESRDRDFIESLMPIWDWLYQYYFRVQTSGWETVPDGQVLVVGSHNGGLAAPDMHMMMYDWFRRFGIDRPVYGLMHAQLSKSFPPPVPSWPLKRGQLSPTPPWPALPLTLERVYWCIPAA